MGENDEVKVYGMLRSPFSRRVETALTLKGIPYEYINEDVLNKSPELLRYNPIHKKVPVLVHNGKPIVESLVILEYIDETWPGGVGSRYPPLLPVDPYDRAMARFWARFIDEKGKKSAQTQKAVCRVGSRAWAMFIACQAPGTAARLNMQLVLCPQTKLPALYVLPFFMDLTTTAFSAAIVAAECLPAAVKAAWGPQEEQEKALEEEIESLSILEKEIQGKKFFGGDEVGFVDIVGNVVAYWFPAFQEAAGKEMLTKEKHPCLLKWVEEYAICSVTKDHLPPRDELVQFYRTRVQASKS